MEGNATIVIIEDDLDMRAVIREALGDAYRLIEYDDAGSAWNAFKGGMAADLVVMDIHMGGGASGIDIANWMRKEPRLVQTPILLLSGDILLPAVSELMQAVGYLQKPCEIKEIKAAVSAALKSA